MDPKQIQQKLNDNGFPCGAVDGNIGKQTEDAIKRFQVAYCGPGGWLDIDGKVGPKTEAALNFLPRLSTHFTASEVACKHCGAAYVNRQLLSALEQLRETFKKPIKVLSVYRCPTHNKSVGGASSSMHMHGAAADIATPISATYVRSVGRFSGIGTRGANVAHVDVRHVMNELNETPGVSPASPATWRY